MLFCETLNLLLVWVDFVCTLLRCKVINITIIICYCLMVTINSVLSLLSINESCFMVVTCILIGIKTFDHKSLIASCIKIKTVD